MSNEQENDEQENDALSDGASNSGSNPLPLLAWAGVSKSTRDMLEQKSKVTEFLALPTRYAQLEFLLGEHGFAEKTTFDYFESEVMSKPEPEPVKFIRKPNETIESYLERAKAHFENITELTVTEIYHQERDHTPSDAEDQVGDHTLSVISAPSNEENPWGFEDMTKQQDVSAPQLMFRRVRPTETERVERSMKHLLSEKMRSILWLGASGIGKSLSLVDLLVQLVRDLVPGRYVGFHRDKTFTIYGKEDGKLKKREKRLEYSVFNDLGYKEFKNDMVILVDPPETVGDFNAFCPTLIALLTRLEPQDLKTFLKQKTTKVTIDPCTQSEVEAMAISSSSVDDEITYKEVMKRYEKIGANLRAILSRTDDEYTAFLSGLNTTRDKDLIAEETGLNPMCIPPHYKYFVAPYNDPEYVSTEEDGGDDDGGCSFLQPAEYSRLRPWSDHTAKKLRELVQNARTKKLLESLELIGIPYVVEENAIQTFLLENNTSDWEWYKNVAHDATVSMEVKNPPNLAVQRVVRFEGRYFKTKLSILQEQTLYKSSGWQMVLGDFFVVKNKTIGPGRIVYMIQVSSRDPEKHPFEVQQYNKWCQSLQMQAADDMVIIYATNKVHKKLHGLKFLAADGKTVVETPCKGYIVRTSMTVGEGATVNQLELGDVAVWTPCNAAVKGLGANWTLEAKGEGSGRQCRARSPGGTDYPSLRAAKAAKAAKGPKGSKRPRDRTTKPKSKRETKKIRDSTEP